MKKKVLAIGLISAVVLLTLTGCMPGDGAASSTNPAGFFWGIWHGWIAPFSLIFGLFDDSIRLYETFNTGWWYDLGYYMAIISGFGSINLFRRKASRE